MTMEELCLPDEETEQFETFFKLKPIAMATSCASSL
jgi:hypothetical protein